MPKYKVATQLDPRFSVEIMEIEANFMQIEYGGVLTAYSSNDDGDDVIAHAWAAGKWLSCDRLEEEED